jgi:hypothetical protein
MSKDDSGNHETSILDPGTAISPFPQTVVGEGLGAVYFKIELDAD